MKLKLFLAPADHSSQNSSSNSTLDDLNYYVSFQVRSSELSWISMPRPYKEIFIYSDRFEAIHLRGGKVARGGIRWSDRADYRTEILALMKAQMSKNSIIIPVGAKGGFWLKKPHIMDVKSEAEACYKIYLNALLDLTDNIGTDDPITEHKNTPQSSPHLKQAIQGKENGDFDPYLVVAADKGTANFSDIANDIAKKRHFWLGDAFASGGSNGYNHKDIGITAKGAWISVEEHMLSYGLNPNHDQFTAIGIGDMSGDVFSNGMILSKSMKLLAAFNHKHIFIDPNPDPNISFAERLRMSKLPASQWSDYNQSKISQGGGIFERSSDLIHLSPEALTALGIPKAIAGKNTNNTDNRTKGSLSLTPNQVIQHILKAPVDLLWNGGIGTYIKSTDETHTDAKDQSNDLVRVNAAELRCKIIAEGGNLGCTQKGRIEYAKNGGKINTDFIDNSGGVSCSDYEVNIKIGLDLLVKKRAILPHEKQAYIAQFLDEVEALVLSHNKHQNIILTLEEESAKTDLLQHAKFIEILSSSGYLNTQLEALPSAEEIALRNSLKSHSGLTKPELSVLLAYAKNYSKHLLKHIDFRSNEDYNAILVNYFPNKMQKIVNFSKHIEEHILANEIICTRIVNEIINITGITWFIDILTKYPKQELTIISHFYEQYKHKEIGEKWYHLSNLPDRSIAHIKAMQVLRTTLKSRIEGKISR